MKINSRRVVPIVVGTRPEAIKLVPLIVALRQSELLEPLVISTGQHHRMVSYIFELADIEPDIVLWSGSRHADLNNRVSSIMRRFADFLSEHFDLHSDRPASLHDVHTGRAPGAVLVHGDTSSAMAAALSNFHLRIPVLHVEAGLRTGSRTSPFPEEMNRQIISRVASGHFAPTIQNLENLVREGIPASQIFVTGNTGIDALQWASQLDVSFANPRLQELHDSDVDIVVVTAHRRENWGDGLAGIVEGITRAAKSSPDTHFVLPVHPNPAVAETMSSGLEPIENVLLTDPLGYATFSKLLGRCKFVLTDSGGIQEEAPSLNKPVLVMRETTERTEGLEAGTLRMVGTDPDRIHTEALRLLEDPDVYRSMAEAPNPYGDGRAAQRIVAAIEHTIFKTEPPQPFGPGYIPTAIIKASGIQMPEGYQFL